jgi:hypothetical protein
MYVCIQGGNKELEVRTYALDNETDPIIFFLLFLLLLFSLAFFLLKNSDPTSVFLLLSGGHDMSSRVLNPSQNVGGLFLVW